MFAIMTTNQLTPQMQASIQMPKPLDKNYIKITQNAVDKIKGLLSNSANEAIGIKVGLKQKGCTGMMYDIEFAKAGINITKYDDCMVFDDFKIFVDPKISVFIIGTTMDYAENDTSSGFNFTNPNEKGKCGCGESFYV